MSFILRMRKHRNIEVSWLLISICTGFGTCLELEYYHTLILYTAPKPFKPTSDMVPTYPSIWTQHIEHLTIIMGIGSYFIHLDCLRLAPLLFQFIQFAHFMLLHHIAFRYKIWTVLIVWFVLLVSQDHNPHVLDLGEVWLLAIANHQKKKKKRWVLIDNPYSQQ